MMSVIKKLLSLALLACSIAAVMSAGTIVPCPTASVAAYVALTGPCQIGSLEFSDFAYSNTYFPTMPGPPASAIQVTPSSNPGDPGLELSSSSWTVSDGVGMDSALTYLVQTISGAPTIDQAAFGITDTIGRPAVTVQFAETLCIGVATGPGTCPSADEIYLLVPSTGTSVSFGPVSVMSVSNDIFIKSDGPSGSGSIADVTNSLPTPEPGVSLLSLSGLLALGLMAKVAANRRRLQRDTIVEAR
jgi:hypothetical protein